MGSFLVGAVQDLLIALCGIFSCGMWDLFLQPGIEPGPLVLGVQRLSHETTKEVPENVYDYFLILYTFELQYSHGDNRGILYCLQCQIRLQPGSEGWS